MFLDPYQNFFSNFTFGCLFFSMLFYFIHFAFPQSTFFFQVGQTSSLAAAGGIFLILSRRWYISGYFPLSNLYESLLFLCWTLLFIHLILSYKLQTKLLGPIIIPIILLINGFGNFTLPIEMQKASPLVPALQSNWLMMHVSLMMLSYAILIIGSLLSIVFLILVIKSSPQTKDEKKVNFPEFSVYESVFALRLTKKSSLKITTKFLEKLDNLSYRIISLGFPLLTIGIIAGAVWANEAWGSYWSWDPKETWALITWLIFAAYLHARIIKGWEGKKPAILASVGFFVVWICYLGVNFLAQGLHSYGWMTS